MGAGDLGVALSRHGQWRGRRDLNCFRSWRCRRLRARLICEAARLDPRRRRDKGQPRRSIRLKQPARTSARRVLTGVSDRAADRSFWQKRRRLRPLSALAVLPPLTLTGRASSQRERPSTAAKLRSAAKNAVRSNGLLSGQRRRRAPPPDGKAVHTMPTPLEDLLLTGSARPSLRWFSNMPPSVS